MFDHKRIITVLPKRLGDALFITPALAFLKKHCPNCQLDVIVLSQLSADVLVNNPDINHVFINPDAAQLDDISATHDMVIELHHNKYVKAMAKQLRLDKFVIPPHPQQMATADYHLNFVASLIGTQVAESDRHYHLYPTENDQAYAQQLLQKGAVQSSEILIGFHLGCHGIAKRGWRFWRPLSHGKTWRLKQYVHLAKLLNKRQSNFRFIITGSKAESVLAKQFCRKIKNSIDLTCKTSVVQFAALMKNFSLFVTPDTGALHVACAMDVTLLALFGPTYLAQTGPYPKSQQHCIVQAEDMSAISPATVAEKSIEMLEVER